MIGSSISTRMLINAGAEVEADPEENPLHWVLNWGHGGSSTSHMYDSTHGPSDAGYYDTCYNWSDFSMVNAATTFIHTYPSSIPAGVYTPSLTVEREYGENCGVRSDTCTLNVIKVNSVSQDKTTACMNQDVTFTANSYPSNKPLSCIQWESRYKATSGGQWGSYSTATGGDNTAVLNTSTAGFYQYRARNGTGDSWKESSEVEIVNTCNCDNTTNGGWGQFFPGFSCPCGWFTCGDCEISWEDACGNEISIECNSNYLFGSEYPCAFKYRFNGLVVGICVWSKGVNQWWYKANQYSYRFLQTKHLTGIPSRGINSYGEGCNGYYCWREAWYNDISGGPPTVYWKRDTTKLYEYGWPGSGASCPGPPGKHFGYPK